MMRGMVKGTEPRCNKKTAKNKNLLAFLGMGAAAGTAAVIILDKLVKKSKVSE